MNLRPMRWALLVLMLLPAGAEDGVPRPLTDAAKRTLGILEKETFESIRFDPEQREKAFGMIRDRLAQAGVTVRFKPTHGTPPPKPGYVMPLVNIPIRKAMEYFDAWAGTGWILYDDGSITYFDQQCGCAWPKAGLYCHDSQYEAGHPSKMKVDGDK